MTNDQTLHVWVGGGSRRALERAADTMTALEHGEQPVAHFEVGFDDLSQMLAVFTPRRWELIAALREAGPMSISALAKLLSRDYKNVHGDVVTLMQWLAIEKDEQGLVYAPFTDISVDVHLPQRRVA